MEDICLLIKSKLQVWEKFGIISSPNDSILNFWILEEFFSFNKFKGYFNNVPILNFVELINALCIPITLFVDKFNIGPPDEPVSVLHLWEISNSLTNPIP